MLHSINTELHISCYSSVLVFFSNHHIRRKSACEQAFKHAMLMTGVMPPPHHLPVYLASHPRSSPLLRLILKTTCTLSP